nr:Ig-like domain-containing protein [Lysinibacter cavernae]
MPVSDNFVVAHSWSTEVDPVANDAGEGLVLSSTTAGGNGVVTVTNGNVLYAPDAAYPWAEGETEYSDTATYVVTDGRGNSATGEIIFTVIKAPVGIDRHLTVANGVESVLFDPIGEAAGTRLVELDAQSVVAEPSNGTVSVEDGTITYHPVAGFDGEDTFSVEIRDALGQRTVVVYTVTVEPAVEPKAPETGDGTTTGPTAEADGGNRGDGAADQTGTPSQWLAVTGAADNVIGVSLLLLASGLAVLAINRRRTKRQTAGSSTSV